MPVSLQELQRLSQESTAYLSLEPLGFPPQTPLNVKATGERMLIRVQWAPVDDVDGYRVAVMTNQNLANPNIGLFTVSGEKQLEFVYSTGNTAITRFFAVQSFSGTQFSEFSPVVSASNTVLTQTNVGGTAVKATTTSSTETVVGTITVPANSLGINDGLQVYLLAIWEGAGATDRTVRLRWGGLTGTILESQAQTPAGTAYNRFAGQLWNQNATNAQIYSTWSGTGTPVTAALDTTAAQTLVVTGQRNTGVAGDTVGLQIFDAFYIRGAASGVDASPPAPPSNPPGSSEPPEYNPRGTI